MHVDSTRIRERAMAQESFGSSPGPVTLLGLVVIRLRIDSVRAILVPQPGLCSYQSPPLEAARAPALRSAVLGVAWLP